jgi:hypothetical protein
MAAESIPTETQLREELRVLAGIGYQEGSTDSLHRVPGLMGLTLLGEATPTGGAMATRRRFDALRSELRDVAETEVRAELGEQYRDAAIKLFCLDEEKLLPRGEHSLTELQQELNDDFGWKESGRTFLTKLRPKLFEVIAHALIQHEERAQHQGEAQEVDDEAKEGETSPAQEKGGPDESDSAPTAPAPQPESETAMKPKPSRKLGAGVLAALFVLAIVSMLVLGVVDLSGSPKRQQPSANAGDVVAAEEFGSVPQSELFTPTCGVLAHPDPAERHQRLTIVDMDAAGRLIPQPPEEHSPPFSRLVQVHPFEVFQASVLIRNAGPAIARNLRLRLSFPTQSSRTAAITAAVEATNARPTKRFRTAGVVSLVSPSGEPFRLDNFRYVTAQRNERRHSLFWGRRERFQSCALEARQTASAYEIAIPPPSMDGTLGVGLDDAYRVSLLADVILG